MSRRSWMVAGGVGAVLLLAAAAGWVGFRALQARDAVTELRADGAALQRQVQAGDVAGAARTLTALRGHADRARGLTGDPVWAVAAAVPVLGRDLHAARVSTAAVARIADAAEPLETALPRLDLQRRGKTPARVDVAALEQVAKAMPAVAAAVAGGAQQTGELDPNHLRPEVGSAVRTLQRMLDSAREPVANAVPVLQQLPPMLGQGGPKTWMVLLQQGAEARGTGGLIGSYAVVRADRGALKLVLAKPRGALGGGLVPGTGIPADVRSLWGDDLRDWTGLNLSPNFPWTGRLVANGWKASGTSARLDYVAGIDQETFAALLAGTGPVSIRGVTVDSQSAVSFLTRDVYQKFDYATVDQVTSELVGTAFKRFQAGAVNLPALVRAMAGPMQQRRVQVWSADPAEQRGLEQLVVGGLLPDTPGPFAMAVVNNAGGNKLDAYLNVRSVYDPGECREEVRVGRIAVRLSNTAPRSGLPAYVSPRTDLIQQGVDGYTVGSNRVLVDIYGPVGGQASAVTVDGVPVQPITGKDRNHPVWRVPVSIDPGQDRLVTATVVGRVDVGTDALRPVILSQPMVNPVQASVKPMKPCAGV